jgi:hypothetical protein
MLLQHERNLSLRLVQYELKRLKCKKALSVYREDKYDETDKNLSIIMLVK